MINLNELCKQTLAIAEQRHKNEVDVGTDTRKMLKHCATEVVEAMEAYTKHTAMKGWSKSYEDAYKKDFESELADIICCVLIIAGKENIDIERAIYDCIEKNERRANGVGDKL